MKRTIKFLSVLMSLTMIMLLVPINAFAASVGVASIEVIEGDKLVEYDLANGFWHDVTGEDVFYYIYDAENVKIKITYTDGTEKIADHKYAVDDGFDEEIRDNSAKSQVDNPWTIGDNNTIVFEYMGKTCSYNVSIIETPVASLEVIDSDVMHEGYDGWFIFPEDESDFFFYDFDAKNANFKVTYKDGTVQTTDHSYQVDDEYNSFIWDIDTQIETHWVPGDNNKITFSYLGVTCEYNVSIIESPVESIEVIQGDKIAKNYDGEWDVDEDGKDYFYYFYDSTNTKLKITYKDGSEIVADHVYEVDDGYNDVIYAYDAQESTHWYPESSSNTMIFTYLGKACKYNIQFDEIAVQKGPDGGWHAYLNDKILTDYTGFADNENGTWYVVNGDVKFDVNSVLYDNRDGTWKYVRESKFKNTYTGIAPNSNGWWRIENGIVNFGATGVYQNENGWWYCKGGKVQFDYTGIKNNAYGWWRIVNGKVDFSATGVYQNENGWWYCKGGQVQFNYTGIKNNANGWWRIVNGKVDFNANGIFSNENGKWYVKNGKVDFSKNGKVTYQGKTYTLKGGKVV